MAAKHHKTRRSRAWATRHNPDDSPGDVSRNGHGRPSEEEIQELMRRDERGPQPTASFVIDEAEARLFKLWTPRELVSQPRDFRWRVKGMLVDGTYGPTGGAKKTLKSYVSAFISVGVAAGVPIFGHFEVPEACTVLAYVGEGGRIPYTNRLERIAESMGVDLDGIPLLTAFDVAPVQSERFQRSLARDLWDREPGLVTVDPLYAYHGSKVSASNLYERGELLSALSQPCIEAGATLQVVDHWNKTGSGRGLDRITQSGMQEWADTWLLLSHRLPPRPDIGQFWLTLEIGSRQWGGAEYELDLDLGVFLPDTGEFDGEISWDLRPAEYGSEPASRTEEDLVAVAARIVADMPWELTESQLEARIGGNHDKVRAAIREAVERDLIVIEERQREEKGGRVRKRKLCGPAS